MNAVERLINDLGVEAVGKMIGAMSVDGTPSGLDLPEIHWPSVSDPYAEANFRHWVMAGIKTAVAAEFEIEAATGGFTSLSIDDEVPGAVKWRGTIWVEEEEGYPLPTWWDCLTRDAAGRLDGERRRLQTTVDPSTGVSMEVPWGNYKTGVKWAYDRALAALMRGLRTLG